MELVETHISYIFMTGKHVYKVRKSVDFGFLDFSTLDKRREDCYREIDLNRRISPDVYLGVVEVRKEGESYAIGGAGEVVEYAVQMRQLPRDRAMNVLLDQGRVKPDEVERIARKIAAFHKKADRGEHITRKSGYPAVRQNVLENFSQTERYIGVSIPLPVYLDLKAFSEAFLDVRRPLLERRAAQGWMRDCHGDLHSAQIFIENGIDIIDCIEFNERFRYCDTVADIGFLAMDLDFHGRSDLSQVLIQAYQYEMDDPDLHRLLGFYKAYRAYVRGKVTSFRLDSPDLVDADRRHVEAEARRYFDLAQSYLRPLKERTLFVVMGLTGTGKTRLSESLAGVWGAAQVSSDRVRKELAGIPPTERKYVGYDAGIYTPEMTDMTYREMLERAAHLLDQGSSVILDGTYRSASRREEAFSMAKARGVPTIPIECTLPDEVVRRRLHGRAKDPGVVSDGRWEIYLRQKREFDPIDKEHITIDTSGKAEESLFQALKKVYAVKLEEEIVG